MNDDKLAAFKTKLFEEAYERVSQECREEIKQEIFEDSAEDLRREVILTQKGAIWQTVTEKLKDDDEVWGIVVDDLKNHFAAEILRAWSSHPDLLKTTESDSHFDTLLEELRTYLRVQLGPQIKDAILLGVKYTDVIPNAAREELRARAVAELKNELREEVRQAVMLEMKNDPRTLETLEEELLRDIFRAI